MFEFAWKVFSKTGNVDTYLLLKELEKEKHTIKVLKRNHVSDPYT